MTDTGNVIVERPPEPPPSIRVTPVITEPKVLGQNPDLTADYIFCNTLQVSGQLIQAGTPTGPLVVGSVQAASYIQFYGPDIGNGYTQSMQIQLKSDPIYQQTAFWITNNEQWQPCLVYMFPSDTANTAKLICMNSNAAMVSGGASRFIAFGSDGINAGAVGGAGLSDLRLYTGANSTQGSGYYGWSIAADGMFLPRNSGSEDIGNTTYPAYVRNIYCNGAIRTGGKAGAAIDGDVNNPTDGMLRFDSTNNRLYIRIGGTWRYATLT